jgi:hypothetical protein
VGVVGDGNAHPTLSNPTTAPGCCAPPNSFTNSTRPVFVDLGCGDGGLLSLLTGLDAWGYDFSAVNQAVPHGSREWTRAAQPR